MYIYANKASRKLFLMGFGYTTCLLGSLMVFVIHSTQWWLAYLIYIFSNVAFGASFVFFYAWTPILTRWHPKVIDSREGGDMLAYYKTSEKVANDISSRGFAWGYLAAVIELVIGIFV
jgi:MFS transporter, UMF1 family